VAASGPTGDVIDAYMSSVAEKEEARLAAEHPSAETAAARFGSGDAAITNVRFFNSQGAEAHVFFAGRPMTVRISYQARQRVDRPVFGVAIYRSDGVHVNGPNTRLAGLDIPFIEGDGEVDYVIESLPLLAGSYDFSAAIYDYECVHALDHQHRAHKFLVQNGDVKEPYGMVYAPSHWEHHTP
jgi:lipopolysaccharide transport system ATP-binding protein